jgi:hypothetical protein
MKEYRTIEISNPGDYIKDGHLGKAMFSKTLDGQPVAWHLHSVSPCKFNDKGEPICWLVTKVCCE